MPLLDTRTPYVDGTPARPSDANKNETNLYTLLNGLVDFDNILAALVNGAGGFVQLDGSALIPLVQIPTTLTGKDADSVDGVDIPATIAELLTDHDKAAHDALDIAVKAADVVNVPAGAIEAENIQAAVDELDAEKLGSAGGKLTGRLSLKDVITIDADDVTPDVSGGNIFVTQANTVATAITDFDNEVQGQVIIVIGGSDTDSPTIADGGNFALKGTFTLAAGSVIFLVKDAGTWREISRYPLATEGIADLAVTEAKIGVGAVTVNKHGDGSVSQPKLDTSTGSANGLLDSGESVNITMNAYSQSPNIYGEGPMSIRTSLVNSSDQIGRFRLFCSMGLEQVYYVRWRYVAASDNPQIWVIQDLAGKIIGVWQSNDPPNNDKFKFAPLQHIDSQGKGIGVLSYLTIPSFRKEFLATNKEGLKEVNKRYKILKIGNRPKGLPRTVQFGRFKKV